MTPWGSIAALWRHSSPDRRHSGVTGRVSPTGRTVAVRVTERVAEVGSRWLRSRVALRGATPAPDQRALHIAAGTASGAGGAVALRALLACVVEQGRPATVTAPKGFDARSMSTDVRYRQPGAPAAILGELLGRFAPDVTTYVGMSDRLPLIRRSPTNIMIAQNPHLYGDRTGLSTRRQHVRLGILRAWAHHSLKHADWVVTATSATRYEVLATAAPSPCCVVVRPIPPQDICTRKTSHRVRVGRLVMIGDVYEYKRFDEAVQAVDQWAATIGRRVQVVHIGRGVEGAAQRALEEAARASRDAAVQLLGASEHERTVSELAGADLFLFPSTRESYGLPLAEALAIGVPVVCRDIPPFRELAGDAALYFSGGAGDMARAIAAAEPQHVRRRMSSVGRSRVTANTGWDVLRPPSTQDT